MSNVFDAHPWLNGAAGALCMALVNGGVGWVRRLARSPGREDLQALEQRLTGQFATLQSNMARGMKDLEGRIEQLGDKVYRRIDEKTDSLGARLDGRIDEIATTRSGGR